MAEASTQIRPPCRSTIFLHSVARNVDSGLLIAPVFNGIADQILEYLHELNLVAVYLGKIVAGDLGTSVLNGELQIHQRPLVGGVQIHGHHRNGVHVDHSRRTLARFG